ncbi:MAG: ABC transporter ATP-binding protein [Lachnospiraceae bacterium]|nr:ABC transporter ATP-binding protein [Lachnospiraceae bacterium]
MNPLITCENLAKNYSGVNALNHITLTLYRGRIIGLLGPNGSGKSTLIKLIAGVLTPTSGNVRINGQLPGIASKEAIAYLPDCMSLNSYMTIQQLVRFFKDFYSNFNEEKAYDMLKRLNLNLNQRFRTLSKGTKEKVQLVLTMSRDADLYLLDEPIGGVDPAARDYILETIISNYSQDASILISTHLITDIENILDDALFINQGNIQMYAPVEEIRNSYHTSLDGYFREAYRC